MRNIKSQPYFWALIVVLILTLSPFGFPPATKASATSIIHDSLPRRTYMSIHILRTPESAKAYAFAELSRYGWDQNYQWQCLKQLWDRESHWNPNSHNTTAVYMGGQKLYAGGVPQILGLDPRTEVTKQVRMGLRYIQYRYSSPCAAIHFWNANFYY